MMLVAVITLCSMAQVIGQVTATPSLDTLNVDTSAISVSGISSGAAMAVQYHVAFSADIMGVGSIAGVPFLCSPMLKCISTPTLIDVPNLWALTLSAQTLGNIDPTSNLSDDKVWIFAGKKATVVKPEAGGKLKDFYSHYLASPSQIELVDSMEAEHGQITKNYGGACNQLHRNNYMNNCNYSGSFHLLNHIYGNLQEPQPDYVAPSAQLKTFGQTEFTTFSSRMDSIGYVYIPTGCDTSTECRLHIAFHGCEIGRECIGDTYVRHSGYNEVAELNDIIILYPQVVAIEGINHHGCWDWTGYINSMYYPFKTGPQMIAIHKMMDHIFGQ